jgi:formiminoglutamase
MITLGGGHDYGAVDGAGFLQWSQSLQTTHPSKPLIINFDAHLDVRPWQRGLNSGTPFSWLLDRYPDQFDFLEIGIQSHCSSPHHRDWLENQKIQILDLNFIRKVGMLNALRHALAGTSPHQNCFISLDIDVFSQSLAPGCSQSWDAGLQYEEMETALSWLLAHKNVRLLGVYEVSPPLDLDHKTSKLAACMMDIFVKNYWTKQ